MTPEKKKIAVRVGIGAAVVAAGAAAWKWWPFGKGSKAEEKAPADGADVASPAPVADAGAPAGTDADGAPIAGGDSITATDDSGAPLEGVVIAARSAGGVELIELRDLRGVVHVIPRHRVRRRHGLALRRPSLLEPEMLTRLDPRHERERLEREREKERHEHHERERREHEKDRR